MEQQYEFDEKLVQKTAEEVIDKQNEEIEKSLDNRLVITVMGIVNVGKSTLIRQILDINYSHVKPEISSIPGTTKKVEIYNLEKNIVIADTPGLEDVNKEIAQKTLDFIKDSDIVLYLFNATIGVSEQQKIAYDRVSGKKPTLVILNKIDAVKKEDDRIKLLEHTKKTLNTDNVIMTCAEEGYNVDKVIKWVNNILEKSGKDLLWAKIARKKDEIVDKWIMGASMTAAAIGALPIPGSDIVPLTACQIGLILKIGSVYGYKLSREDARALIGPTLSGMIGRTIFRQLVKLFPGVGWLVAAAIAGSITYALGKTMKMYFKSGMTIPIEQLGQIAVEYAKEAKQYEDIFKEERKKAKSS